MTAAEQDRAPEGWTAGPWLAESMTMTKRDWAALNDGSSVLTIVTHGADVVACVWADEDTEESANARLIAAAPHLYEALVALEAEARQYASCTPECERAHAALAAARGDASALEGGASPARRSEGGAG